MFWPCFNWNATYRSKISNTWTARNPYRAQHSIWNINITLYWTIQSMKVENITCQVKEPFACQQAAGVYDHPVSRGVIWSARRHRATDVFLDRYNTSWNFHPSLGIHYRYMSKPFSSLFTHLLIESITQNSQIGWFLTLYTFVLPTAFLYNFIIFVSTIYFFMFQLVSRAYVITERTVA